MGFHRRQFLQLAVGATVSAAGSRVAGAETYPARPVRIIVGYTPGGSTDIIARLIGQQLSEQFGQPFVIENRPGAGANIATESVVRSPADGYTLLLVNSADTINATLYPRLNFTFIRDVAPVASLARQPQVVLANPSLPAKTLPELIAFAKANPGKVTMASPGNGTIGHLSGEMLKTMAGIDLLHVPYRGAAPALTDLIAGHVQILFTGMTGSIEYSRVGKINALAVTTSTRSDALPDVPAVSEFVPGYEAVSLFGIGAPRNTPAKIVGALNREINAALAHPAIAARVVELGGTVLTGSPAEFADVLANETDKWRKVIRAANVTAG
jgi:tripartite-type tricarboxylate transporter receptor subunit TctC